MPRKKHNPKLLKAFFDPLLDRFHRVEHLNSDPLGVAHEWERAEDREIVAIFAALLAYGNAFLIRRTLHALFDPLREGELRPYALARKYAERPEEVREFLRKLWAPYFYRFNSSGDFVLLFELIARSIAAHGSVGAHFLRKYEGTVPSLLESWAAFIEEWRTEAATFPKRGLKGFSYLLNSPVDGSACKRWVMLLRWMGRRDEIDFGLWAAGNPLPGIRVPLSPRHLFMPIDTHTGRISTYLGILKRKQYNWKAVEEVTEFFRELHPEDPILYDFALARLGILDLCQKRYRVEICQACSLLPVCHFAKRQGS